MELVVLEVILWVGLAFFFWALREGLSHVKTDMESLGLAAGGEITTPPAGKTPFHSPDSLAEPIGTYQNAPIFRYARIQGRSYQFDRVCPPDLRAPLDKDERYIAPGLVYQECDVPEETFL